MQNLKYFTPGPVTVDAHILAIGAQQLPYNRTEEFSALTHEIVSALKYVFQTEGEVVLLTASGTAAMEAAVLNFLDSTDKVLIINGGTFGQRWCDLCRVHSIPYSEISVAAGSDVNARELNEVLLNEHHSALLVNAHETSTGHLFDIEAIGKIARLNGALFIVDAISSICADKFLMDEWRVDVAVLSSHKALALPPGLSFVAMNPRAIRWLERKPVKSLYFDLRNYLENQVRGQVPFTPAIGLLMQLHQRLFDIRDVTLPALVHKHKQRAELFRQSIREMPFDLLPSKSSNAMTALTCRGVDAMSIVRELRVNHGIVIAPNGGDLKSKVVRVSHMGAQEDTDTQQMIQALRSCANSVVT